MIKNGEYMLNALQLSKLLNISIWTLNQWRVNGGGPGYYKIKNIVYYSQSDLQKWIIYNKLNYQSLFRIGKLK